MAKAKPKSQKIVQALQSEASKLNTRLIIVAFVGFVVLGLGFFFVVGSVLGQTVNQWLPGFGVAALVLLGVTGIFLSSISSYKSRTIQMTARMFDREMSDLRAVGERAEALKSMASVMRATLSFERVVEEALDACHSTLVENDITSNDLAGAVLLFRGSYLYPVASRRLIGGDLDRGVPAKEGLIADSLTKAETITITNPGDDPELKQFSAFQNAATVICIPLRAGFHLFGAMIISSTKPLQLKTEDTELFNAVADQAVIAIQNAELYQRLEAEKERLIAADEAARKELARDLHDGPTQTIAAIAMRVNFIRSLMTRDPDQALDELQKVEELAKRTAKEIRGMLFTLRPLVLETQGLAPAIETVMNRIKESDGLNIRLVGGENGDLLNDSAQSVVFSIVEEALGNARKHSQAELIEVRFWQEDNLFVTRIRDNGVGFNVEDVNRDYSSRGSLGMINLQERAERIDGSIRIDSEQGKGTSVTLVVPLDKQGRTDGRGRRQTAR